MALATRGNQYRHRATTGSDSDELAIVNIFLTIVPW
jgi:hypothetical protein